MEWLVPILLIVVLVVIASYVSEGPIRMLFYILALAVAIWLVVRLTGIG